MKKSIAVCVLVLSLALVGAAARAQEANPGGGTTQLRSPDVVYVPTPTEVVEAMLKVAKVGKGDVVYDLGSGDGRIPILAVEKYHAERAVGIDINPERVREAQANAKKAGVEDRVRFLNQDLFESKISDATVVTLYLLSTLNVKLRPKLLEDLKSGTRVVSHAFDMGSWKPKETLTIDGRQVYFWIIPQKGTPEYQAAMAAAGKTTSR
ncbi:MAG: methyltransferase domain-containing protein [Deltaproteobacteria bacterium]|nr:methyltransferase domain-containing protein [Deltaproteobacteria bacterium]